MFDPEAKLCDTCDDCLIGGCICHLHDDQGARDDYLYDQQRDLHAD
jgi:hypothetical protein